LLENFPPWATASVTLHSTHCSIKSRSTWLQPQQSPKIPNAVHHSQTCKHFLWHADVLLLRHTHDSTIHPRKVCVAVSQPCLIS